MMHRIVIFGDSHYACMKKGLDAGLVTLPEGVELEFWGHVGRRFRFLDFVDGAITPVDDYTAARFAKFSTRKRKTLPIRDFDTVFFMGCRIPTFNAFAGLIEADRKGDFISTSLRDRILQDFLGAQKPYTFAQAASALGAAQIVVMPESFPTWLPEKDVHHFPKYPQSPTTGLEERKTLWKATEAVMQKDGITLLPQPEETVTEGLYTHPDYAVEGYREKPDLCHRNATYGALAFNALLKLLPPTPTEVASM